MLEITKDNIIKYSDRYDKGVAGSFDEYGEKELKEWFRANRYLDREKFIRLGKWKSRRPIKHYESNGDNLIKDITNFSLSTDNEEARIKILFVLKGVSWPVASTILHFAFPDKYPIMDFRAIWSLGWEQPKSYNYNFWKKYCDQMQSLSDRVGLPIRTIDKALWQYSKENQPRK